MLEVIYSLVNRTLPSVDVTKRNNNEAFCYSRLLHLNDNDTTAAFIIMCFHHSCNKTVDSVVILGRHQPIII